MKEKELICISCPLGCSLTVIIKGEDNVQVQGYGCQRGLTFGKEEALSPKRVVTATVGINSSECARLPVRTDSPLLKNKIHRLLKHIYSLNLNPPVNIGDSILKDFEKTGVNLVATRTILE